MAVDDVEFREFFASQYARLCWLGLLLTGDQAEAEELAQEALARVWRDWARVRTMDSPGGYLHRVAMNLATSQLRRRAAERRARVRCRRQP